MASIILRNVAETLAYGVRIGATLKRGEVLALCGDLGAGKTHFTKGLAAGLGAPVSVTSPTFTLVHEYRGGRLPLFHFDFYRLETEQEALRLGLDEYLDGDGVTVIEWADKFPRILPLETRWLRFRVFEGETRGLEETRARPR